MVEEEDRDEIRECSICGLEKEETDEIEQRVDPQLCYWQSDDPVWMCEHCYYRRSQGEGWRPGDE